MDNDTLLRIEKKLDMLLAQRGGQGMPFHDTPASRKSDIDKVVLRFAQRRKKMVEKG